MKIDISQISSEPLEISQKEDPALLELETAEINFISPLLVSCRVIKIAESVKISGLFKAEVRLSCSRCTEKFLSKIKGKFNFNYPIEEKNILDITDDIRQEVILSYPAVALCKKGCKGLCASCGQNLNKGRCRCKVKIVNRRFDKLREWKG